MSLPLYSSSTAPVESVCDLLASHFAQIPTDDSALLCCDTVPRSFDRASRGVYLVRSTAVKTIDDLWRDADSAEGEDVEVTETGVEYYTCSDDGTVLRQPTAYRYSHGDEAPPQYDLSVHYSCHVRVAGDDELEKTIFYAVQRDTEQLGCLCAIMFQWNAAQRPAMLPHPQKIEPGTIHIDSEDYHRQQNIQPPYADGEYVEHDGWDEQVSFSHGHPSVSHTSTYPTATARLLTAEGNSAPDDSAALYVSVAEYGRVRHELERLKRRVSVLERALMQPKTARSGGRHQRRELVQDEDRDELMASLPADDVCERKPTVLKLQRQQYLPVKVTHIRTPSPTARRRKRALYEDPNGAAGPPAVFQISRTLNNTNLTVSLEDGMVRQYRFSTVSKDGQTKYYRCSKCDYLRRKDKTKRAAYVKVWRGKVVTDPPEHNAECLPMTEAQATAMEVDRKCRLGIKDGSFTPRQSWELGRAHDELNRTAEFPSWKKVRSQYTRYWRARKRMESAEATVGEMDFTSLQAPEGDYSLETGHNLASHQASELNFTSPEQPSDLNFTPAEVSEGNDATSPLATT